MASLTKVMTQLSVEDRGRQRDGQVPPIQREVEGMSGSYHRPHCIATRTSPSRAMNVGMAHEDCDLEGVRPYPRAPLSRDESDEEKEL